MTRARRRRVASGLIIAASLGWGGASTAPPTDSALAARVAFRHANERYRQGQFSEAVEGYREALRHGVESGALYYNLGNALLRDGREGEALWAYRRAQRLSPRDTDLHANAVYLASLLAAAGEVSVGAPRIVRWLTLEGYFADGELAVLVGLLLWAVAIGWSVSAWYPAAKGMVRPVARIAGCGAGLAMAALIAQTWWESRPLAVTVIERAEARFAPQESATVHFPLPEGTLVMLLQRQFGWAQVRRGDGRSGWISEGSVKPL